VLSKDTGHAAGQSETVHISETPAVVDGGCSPTEARTAAAAAAAATAATAGAGGTAATHTIITEVTVSWLANAAFAQGRSQGEEYGGSCSPNGCAIVHN